MAQFDVYENINESTNEFVPYLLDIQNDILKKLSTRVVVPLVINIEAIKNLNPEFIINDKKLVMNTTQLAGVSLAYLGEKVCSLENDREEIINAIDFMITGF